MAAQVDYAKAFWSPTPSTPLDILLQHLQRQQDQTVELKTIAQQKITYHKSVAKALLGTKVPNHAHPEGSITTAIDQIHTSTKNDAQNNTLLAQKVETTLQQTVQDIIKKQVKLIKETKNEWTKSNKALQQAKDKNEKAKDKYYQLAKDEERLKEDTKNATPDKQPALQKKCDSVTASLKQAEVAYQKQVSILNGQQQIWEDTCIRCCREIQTQDSQRISSIQAALKEVTDFELQMVTNSTLKLREKVSESVSLINPHDDLALFTTAHKTGIQPPPRANFLAYGQKEVVVAPREVAPLEVPAAAEPVASPSPVSVATFEVPEETYSPKQPNRPAGFNYLTVKRGEGAAADPAALPVVEADILKVELRKTVKKERPPSMSLPNQEGSDFRGTLKRGMTLAQAAQAAQEGTPGSAITDQAEGADSTGQAPVLTSQKPKPVNNAANTAFLLGHAKEPSVPSTGFAVPVAPAPKSIQGSIQELNNSASVLSPVDSGYSPESPQKESSDQLQASTERGSTPQIAPRSVRGSAEMLSSHRSLQGHLSANDLVAKEQNDEKEENEEKEDNEQKAQAEEDFHPADALKVMTFSRAGIKMEGWLQICDDATREWTRRWCALEGERIWFFETPEENSKAQGANKPKGMQSVARSTILAGCDSAQAWLPPDLTAHPHTVTIVPPTKKICFLSAAERTDALLWQEALSQTANKAGRALVV